jgi:mersacidin/lichenicidin family type 2 lantibiotic
MTTQNIIRAWKNKAYRESLSEAERALLPENPAGLIELTDVDLGQVAGGQRTIATARCPSACDIDSCMLTTNCSVAVCSVVTC